MTLVYVAGKPDKISLVADADRICRPDLIIECRERKDWFNREEREKIELHYDTLKPTQGTCIVSKEPISEQEQKKLDGGICLLTVSFDQLQLEPIINTLTNK